MAFSDATTIASQPGYFKRVYGRANLKPLVLKDNVTLNAIDIAPKAHGQGLFIPLVVDIPVGGSATPSAAVRNAYGSQARSWNLTLKNGYAAVNISAKDQADSKNNEAAFVNLKNHEIKLKLGYMGEQRAREIWSDGSAEIGQVVTATLASGVSGAVGSTYTLQMGGGDAYYFHLNQVLTGNVERVIDATPTNNKNYRLKVTAVDDAEDIITVELIEGSVPPANLDYLFIDGDHGSLNAAASALCLTGIPAYIPASNPGTGGVPASLNGIDRSERPTLLAGWRGENVGSIQESCKSLLARMGRYAKLTPKAAFMMSFEDWQTLESEMEGRVYRDDAKTKMFGTNAIIVHTAKGSFPAIAIPELKSGTCFFGDLSTYQLRHLEGFPHMRMDGDTSSVRTQWENDEDGERVEFRSWHEGAITDPSSWGRFPTV